MHLNWKAAYHGGTFFPRQLIFIFLLAVTEGQSQTLRALNRFLFFTVFLLDGH